MKKLFLFMIIVSSLSFGQGWNTIVTTTLNEPNLSKMDLFTNKNGNHLLIKRYNGNIVYYNLNSSSVVDANKTITLETIFFSFVVSLSRYWWKKVQINWSVSVFAILLQTVWHDLLPPPIYFYWGAKNGTDIYKPAFYSSV